MKPVGRAKRVPADNNAFGRGLQKVALGRKNWLLVSNPESGQNSATRMTRVSTCGLNGVTWRRISRMGSCMSETRLFRIQSRPAAARREVSHSGSRIQFR